MAIEFSFKKNTQNPTAIAGLTSGEPAFNTVLNTLFIGKGHGITAAWVGAPISNDYLQIAAGLTQQIPTLGAVKDYANTIGARTTTQSSVPSGTLYNGDRWINTNTGKQYTYTQYGITGGTASFWVEYK